ncbi:MAG TPA: CHASE3 domain-containing protein [Polyangiaceae bacterium]|nr:CHASE3 domain-containing protein [Polyangiaceae bacterium]
MFVSWTFGRKLVAGFGLAGGVLLVIAVLGYRSTQRLIENERWVAHTHEVRGALAHLRLLLVGAETAQRGFIIVGNETFLEPYTRAVQELPKALSDVRTLTADNPEQARRLQTAADVLRNRLSVMDQVIQQRKAKGLPETSETVAAGHGKQLMDQLLALLDEADASERTLLAQRQAEAESTATLTQAVILWGSVLGSLLVAGMGAFIARSLSSQVASAVQHIQSSSAELQSAAGQQATGAKEQATAMSEITTTISELLATSRQIAESAQRVAEISARTARAARSGDNTVERGNESVSSMRHHVGLIVGHMLELGKKSQEIGVVLDIVSELAEQTNILAINATIEAAGAGDAGRRFSVVADEIRKLSDRVAGSTKEIRGLIDEVRSAVNTTIMTTETGSKAIEAGSKQFAEVASAFNQISLEVTTTTEAAKEIELSTKQQATAVEQVNVAMSNVAQVTKETEVSTVQTQRTATELAGLSRELLRIVQPNGQLPHRQLSA